MSKHLENRERLPERRAAIYSRVSTEDQNLEQQVTALRRHCRNNRLKIVIDIREKISSRDTRPGHEEVLRAARRRDIDYIVVWKLDRWGRSLRDLVLSLDELSRLGVGFFSVTESLDLATAAGRALTGMLAVFAEFERDVIRERTLAGLAHARSRGKKLGRPIADHRAEAYAIRNYRAEGLSYSEIAKKLKISKSSVGRILHEVKPV